MARDFFHNIVKNALIKDGWTITDDPLYLEIDESLGDLQVDFGAQKIIVAEQDSRKIAVEVKTFRRASLLHEFHLVVGQFLNYHMALEELEPDRVLYLAIPQAVFETLFKRPFIQRTVKRRQIKLIVYDVSKEVIVLWQE